jgi:hypothetical protein
MPVQGFSHQADQGGFIRAHNDPGIGAADEESPLM